MVDSSDTTSEVVVDASPLIYLAKLDALDVFGIGGYEPLVPQAVMEETTRPALIYRHPDAAHIEMAASRGELRVVELSPAETDFANKLAAQVPGLSLAECQVLGVANARGLSAVVFERRARAIARAYGIGMLEVIELLFNGTPDDRLLETRIRRFAEMVSMRLGDFEALRERIARRRLR